MHDALDGPSEDMLANRQQNEGVDFARSHGSNAQFGIAIPYSSKNVFGNLLPKVSEAAKFLVNRHAKPVAIDIRASIKLEADAAVTAKAADEARLTATTDTGELFVVVDATDADMSDAPNADTACTTTDLSADEENEESRDDDAPVYFGSDEVDCDCPNVKCPTTAGFSEDDGNFSASGQGPKSHPGTERSIFEKRKRAGIEVFGVFQNAHLRRCAF